MSIFIFIQHIGQEKEREGRGEERGGEREKRGNM